MQKMNSIEALTDRAKAVNPDTFLFIIYIPDIKDTTKLVAWYSSDSGLRSISNDLIMDEERRYGLDVTSWMTPEQVTFNTIENYLEVLVYQFAVMSGDIIGDEGWTWQEHASFTAGHLRQLAEKMEQAALGNTESFMSIPAITETMVIKVTD